VNDEDNKMSDDISELQESFPELVRAVEALANPEQPLTRDELAGTLAVLSVRMVRAIESSRRTRKVSLKLPSRYCKNARNSV
jgi:hypothetical protein